MLHDASFAGSGVCFAERLCLAGNYRTTCGACVSECIDFAGEQYQLQGRSSFLCGADSIGGDDRPERRCDGAAAGIDGHHGEYFKCGKLGWILFDMSAEVDHVECAGDYGFEFDQRGGESNNTQPITAIARDKMNQTVLTGLSLEFVSTTPTTIPAAAAEP
jgi:hypothetical protein